jgi:hypothetical protein
VEYQRALQFGITATNQPSVARDPGTANR